MNLWNTIATGLREIWAHKFRSMLTMLGIVLGVCSLVAMSALVKGMENGLTATLVELGGLEKIEIQENPDLPVYQQHLQDQTVGLSMADVTALKYGAPLVGRITPAIELSGWEARMRVTYGTRRTGIWRLLGSWPEVLDLEEYHIEHGRMFNEIDNESARRVAVIGHEVRKELFSEDERFSDPEMILGQTIFINQIPFTVIGLLPEYLSETERKQQAIEAAAEPVNSGQDGGLRRSKGRGNSGPNGWVFRMKNDTVLIPLNSLLLSFKPMPNRRNPLQAVATDYTLTTIHMKIPSLDLLEKALQQVRNVMMVTHNGLEDWMFRTEEEMAEEITKSIQNYRMSGSIIAAIGLIVGGIGIMNIMLASISERVREIGIRKAVGASTEAIFIQILIESLVISILGALLGLGVSVGLVEMITSFTPSDNDPQITLSALLMAFSCSAAVGIVAGLIPAVKASRLHPIQALKYD